MAKNMIKWLQMTILAAGLGLAMGGWSEEASVTAAPEASSQQESAAAEVERERPGFHRVFWDAVLVKPIGLVSMVVGSAVFVVTLPISIPTGTVGEAGASLVVDPAKDVFARCLGCTEVGWRKLPAKELEQH